MNIAELATQTFQVVTQGTISAIYIEADDGTVYDIPRLESYDAATDTATFVLLDALPDGDYQLHLSGADGLADLGGNPLVGNDPGGDYVVPFTVDAPPRGDGGNPLEWSDQASNDQTSDPQDLGILFPDELAAGVTISRFSQDPQDTADGRRRASAVSCGSWLKSRDGDPGRELVREEDAEILGISRPWSFNAPWSLHSSGFPPVAARGAVRAANTAA